MAQLKHPSEMGILGGLGYTLASMADPSVPFQYMGALAGQQEAGLRQQELDWRKQDRQRELAEIERQRQQAAIREKILGNIFAQGQGGINRNQMGEFIAAGGTPQTLGSIQELLSPSEDLNLIEVYDPVSKTMKYVRESEAIGMPSKPAGAQSPQLPAGVGLPEGYMPTFENGVFTGAKPVPGLDVGVGQREIPQTLPQLTTDPLAGFKDKEKAQIEMLKQSEDKIKSIEEGLDDELNVVSRLERFEQLLEVQETSPAQRAIPYVGYIDPELREMKKIQSEIAPRMRVVGSGSSSDKDVEMFKESTVDPTAFTQTNKNIIIARKAAAQNKVDRAKFFREYQAAYGHTKGAEKNWQDYLDNNSIFDHKAPKEEFRLNPSRLNYEQYFQAKNIRNEFKNGNIDRQTAIEELKKLGMQ